MLLEEKIKEFLKDNDFDNIRYKIIPAEEKFDIIKFTNPNNTISIEISCIEGFVFESFYRSIISFKELNDTVQKKYRVFFHYYRKDNEMTVHYKGKCYHAKNVECNIPVETKWNDKQQPHLVLQGWSMGIKHLEEENKIIIL